MIVLANARVVGMRRVGDPGWVSVLAGRIVAVGSGGPPDGAGTVHDLERRYLLPGFIDLHMHGGGGAQVTTDDPDEIMTAVGFHRRHGTTRTLASLVTDRLDRMAAAAGTIAELVRRDPDGPIVGGHPEGPFPKPTKRGSH